MKRHSVHPVTIRSRQGGFSLIEVLVALLVLSIGLLGLAALQTAGLRFNTQSYQRTQAVLLSYDIIDRIRANPVARANGDYNNVAAGPPGAYNDCTAGACTPTQLAAYDIGIWKNAILNQLGATGDGQIGTAGTIRTITINWTESDVPIRLAFEADLN